MVLGQGRQRAFEFRSGSAGVDIFVLEKENMKIKSLTIKNVKSFKEETEIIFDEQFNILIGPNGGGKSNLLDIIAIVIRNFFIKGYSTEESSDEKGFFKNIRQHTPFQISRDLDKFVGDLSASIIKIVIMIGREDIENIKLLKENKEKFEHVINSSYRSKPTENFVFLNSLDFGIIKENQELTYIFENNNIPNLPSNTPEGIYFLYLNHYELFVLLAREIEDINLKPICLYFSPYRGASQQDLQANLSSQNYQQLLANYYGSTSKTTTSLIGLATHYFAEKRRGFEDSAKELGYEEKWNNDEEVKLATKYLNRLGYSWNLQLININKNIYEIVLSKEGKSFNIRQASSGEKEIINFLLGIFALNIKKGLIVIDEPELHLHPKWQSILTDLFVELATNTGNQFIISTHSPVFINDKTISNVIRVYKDSNNTSKIVTIKKDNLTSVKDLLHIVNSHNNEKIFFADKVVLVEGIQDRLIFEKLINHYAHDVNKSEIIEVLEVHGKENLLKYREFLENIEVENCIIADFDYIFSIGDESMRKLSTTDFKKIDEKVIKDKKSVDRETLAQKLETSITSKTIDELKYIWEYIKNRFRKLKEGLNDEEREFIASFIKAKKEEKIYILQKGEIENYLPEGFKKLEKTIELIKDENFNKWLSDTKDDDKRKELDGIVFEIIEIEHRAG